MARIVETNKEYEVCCPKCGKKIGFTIDDVWSSYERGLEYSDGWLDPDCVWNYIHCPNCDKTISVDTKLDDEEWGFLTKKYENNLCE